MAFVEKARAKGALSLGRLVGDVADSAVVIIATQAHFTLSAARQQKDLQIDNVSRPRTQGKTASSRQNRVYTTASGAAGEGGVKSRAAIALKVGYQAIGRA